MCFQRVPRRTSSVGRSRVESAEDLGCRLPYNQPGVADYLQLRERRPIAPSIQLPPRAAGGGCMDAAMTAAPLRPLLIWRQSFPFNYMEFMRRVLGEAPTLLALSRAGRPLVYVPLDRNLSLPPYYDAVLGAPMRGAAVRSLSGALTAPGEGDDARIGVSSAMLCCVKKPTKMNASAAFAYLRMIADAHAVTGGSGGSGGLSGSGGSGSRLASGATVPGGTAEVLLIIRTPPKWAKAGSERRIQRLSLLLEACRRSGRSCETIDFGALPYGEGVRRVRSARALVGVHGAGLANAVFLKQGMVAVELMPRAFAASAHSFGAAKFGFLPALGVRHVRVAVAESDPRCVERAGKVAERLRDCDVTVEWRQLEHALLAGK